MRFLWVDAGNDANFIKATPFGINGYFYALADPVVDLRKRLEETHRVNTASGLYMVSSWPEFKGKTGSETAELVHAMVEDIAPAATPTRPKIQFDMEEHNPEKILECLTRWRELRPQTDTSWTMESFQGGWMSPDFVARMIALKVRIVPQFYKGRMADLTEPDPVERCRQLLAEQVAQDQALRNLTRRGFPERSISGFYDAATLPHWWDGFAFTQGRLP